MRRLIVPLFAANLIAFGSVGISYLLYSRLLSAAQFGAYAAALAVGNLAVLVLDGGIRTSIIKHDSDLSEHVESSLLTLMLAFSLLLLLALYAGQSALAHLYPAARHQTAFVSLFAAVYLLTYPWIGLSTAQLERQLQYPKIAWIESTAVVLERGAPAIFLLVADLGLSSFVVGLILGRLTRLILLRRLHRVRWNPRLQGDMKTIRTLLREGLAFQIGGAASLIRDNAHVIVVGPLFGAVWVGYYAWGFQLCTIASQAFVQISARVSLPVTAQAARFFDRWPTITLQVALLTAATTPILTILLLISPVLDHWLFADKWRIALTILPFFCGRMIPGIACTPVGTLLLVEKGAARYAGALWVWSAIELMAAYAAVALIGPGGMAMSYALTAWIGLFVLLQAFGRPSAALFGEVCGIIVRRPALWVFSAIACADLYLRNAWDRALPPSAVIGAIAISLATYLLDPVVRSAVRPTRV
jgi:O-antigen/teichoic acid export membrane protein